MPALITHHIFGEDIAQGLPAGLLEGEEELFAFLLGNEGPDPFFARFSTLPERAETCHQLAYDLQGRHVTRSFLEVRSSVSHLPTSEERIGRAFALGMLGHYALDRTAHPFIFSQQYALLAQPGLQDAPHEVHAVIESDLDVWVLWEKRHQTVLDAPAACDLMRTQRIERVAGALLSQVALAVYGVEVDPDEYAGALRDYAWIFRRIDPAGTPKLRLIAAIERLGRPHSMAASMAHYVTRSDECASANLERTAWENPFTGEVRHASFADLYDEATGYYHELAEAYVKGDAARLRALVGGLNYDGRPIVDD